MTSPSAEDPEPVRQPPPIDLSRFDLTVQDVETFLRGGYDAGRTYFSSHAPAIAAGITRWMRIVELMNESQCQPPRNWDHFRHLGLEGVVNADRTIALIPVLGDSNTGVSLVVTPHNRDERGPITSLYVKQNKRQGLLFAASTLAISTVKPTRTWFLLYARTKSEIRWEISLPLEVFDGRVIAWGERLIGPPIDLSDDDVGQNDPSAPPDHDMEVNPRGD